MVELLIKRAYELMGEELIDIYVDLRDINFKLLASMTVEGSGNIYFDKYNVDIEDGIPFTMAEFEELIPTVHKIEFEY